MGQYGQVLATSMGEEEKQDLLDEVFVRVFYSFFCLLLPSVLFLSVNVWCLLVRKTLNSSVEKVHIVCEKNISYWM